MAHSRKLFLVGYSIYPKYLILCTTSLFMVCLLWALVCFTLLPLSHHTHIDSMKSIRQTEGLLKHGEELSHSSFSSSLFTLYMLSHSLSLSLFCSLSILAPFWVLFHFNNRKCYNVHLCVCMCVFLFVDSLIFWLTTEMYFSFFFSLGYHSIRPFLLFGLILKVIPLEDRS